MDELKRVNKEVHEVLSNQQMRISELAKQHQTAEMLSSICVKIVKEEQKVFSREIKQYISQEIAFQFARDKKQANSDSLSQMQAMKRDLASLFTELKQSHETLQLAIGIVANNGDMPQEVHIVHDERMKALNDEIEHLSLVVEKVRTQNENTVGKVKDIMTKMPQLDALISGIRPRHLASKHLVQDPDINDPPWASDLNETFVQSARPQKDANKKSYHGYGNPHSLDALPARGTEMNLSNLANLTSVDKKKAASASNVGIRAAYHGRDDLDLDAQSATSVDESSQSSQVSSYYTGKDKHSTMGEEDWKTGDAGRTNSPNSFSQVSLMIPSERQLSDHEGTYARTLQERRGMNHEDAGACYSTERDYEDEIRDRVKQDMPCTPPKDFHSNLKKSDKSWSPRRIFGRHRAGDRNESGEPSGMTEVHMGGGKSGDAVCEDAGSSETMVTDISEHAKKRRAWHAGYERKHVRAATVVSPLEPGDKRQPLGGGGRSEGGGKPTADLLEFNALREGIDSNDRIKTAKAKHVTLFEELGYR